MRIAAGGKVFVFEKRVRLKIDAGRMKVAPGASGEAGTKQQ